MEETTIYLVRESNSCCILKSKMEQNDIFLNHVVLELPKGADMKKNLNSLNILFKSFVSNFDDSKKEQNDVLNKPIPYFNFNMKIQKLFKRHEIKTLKDLARLNPNELLMERNIGRKTIKVLGNFLEKHNLKWNYWNI